MNLYTRFLYRTNLLITILFPKHCSVTAVLDGHICNECFRLFLPARRYASAGTSYGQCRQVHYGMIINLFITYFFVRYILLLFIRKRCLKTYSLRVDICFRQCSRKRVQQLKKLKKSRFLLLRKKIRNVKSVRIVLETTLPVRRPLVSSILTASQHYTDDAR